MTDLSDKIKKVLLNRNVEWQRHALERMAERDISRDDVLRVLLIGECMENYPETKPFPSFLFLGEINARPLHVVAACDVLEERLFIITAYEPDLQHFEPGFKIRRKT